MRTRARAENKKMAMKTYPQAFGPTDLVMANQNAKKPVHYAAGDWSPGVTGDDDHVSKASVALARSGGGANEPDYTPRQYTDIVAKPNWTSGTIRAPDVGRPEGQVGPTDRYPNASDTALAAPTITSLSPNTAVHGAQPLVVTITGTGFTQWSSVVSGGTGSPWDSTVKYLSPTQMTIVVDPRPAVAGTASIVVWDHGVASAASNFTFT
jgi:hypothetical protein